MIIPAGHRLLVKPEKLEDIDPALKSARAMGILLVESEKKKEQAAVDKGRVIAVGNTAFKDFGGDAWCEVGDLIAYAKYGGKYVTDPDSNEEFLLLNDEDVVCRFVKD